MDRTQLTLKDGVIEGLTESGVRRFLSVPYAAPVTEARRFRKPEPVEPWEGVRDASCPGSQAPQSTPATSPHLDVSGLMGTPEPDSDEFLTLNVFSGEGAEMRPVMVFIHGGSFVYGSKDVPLYDGRSLARDGVVCVVINYRLGMEGFLPAPGMDTNVGFRDMIAALQWVKDNIVVFGGDPDNVTLFGESGGAWCTAALMTSPLAKGLFHHAIPQSGHGYLSRDIGHMQKLVRRLAKRLKVTPDRDGFASVPRDKMLRAQDWVMKPRLFFDMKDEQGRDPSFGITRFLPVHGDDVFPIPTIEAFAQGAGREIDLLIGSTSEEANMFFMPGDLARKLPRWAAVLFLGKGQPRTVDALRAYGLDKAGVRPGEALTKALTDLMFRAGTRKTAELHQGRTWVYEFDWRSNAVGGKLGAAHAVELPFVFDTLALATGPKSLVGEDPPQALADSIRAIWVGFATDGTAPWPQFDASGRQVYSLTQRSAAFEPVMPAVDFLP